MWVLICMFLLCLRGVDSKFNWTILPRFMHVRFFGNWTASQLDSLTRVRMITIQPYQGGWGEDQVSWSRAQIHSINPIIPVLLYYNVWYSEPIYRANLIVRNHSGWWLNDTSGHPLQPGGRYVFDMRQAGARDFWVSVLAGAVAAGWSDGGFGDNACGSSPSFLNTSEQTRFRAGQLRVQAATQDALGAAPYIQNCPDPAPGVQGVMFENFCSDFGPHSHAKLCLDHIRAIQSYEARHLVIQTRFHLNSFNNHNPIFGIAAFLIAAYEGTYFGASVNWNLDGDWDRMVPAYTKALGPPMEAAQSADGCTWTRRFEHATAEALLCNGIARVHWAAGAIDEAF
eukprot:TRINITY_DN19883_c0_g1_i1.p1 TRINITY_DN19883_c0_g1~~TRINITY_DN19883_c0_g1_i1.p1  ORF type:complete len:356 (-),score=68.20 TRINITY_DN19883_c0_g1_i1:18-1040(-)